MSDPKRDGIFPGWWVVAGAFLCMMTGYAVAYSFAAFFGALSDEFGARRGETAMVFSISAFLYFVLGFPAGLIADRTGPRPVVIGGLLLIAIGLVVAARASSLGQVYAGYGLGVGVGIGLSYVPSVVAVQRWFVRRRGTASGIAVAGIDPGYYAAIGFPVAGPRAIRIDMLDRLIARLHRMTVKGAMPPDPTIAQVLGCGKEEADAVLLALGWGRREEDGIVVYRRQRPPRPQPNAQSRRRVPPLGDGDRSPFAILRQLRPK